MLEGEIEQIKELLHVPKDVVIVSHRNPDGDALGSSLAIKLFLKRLGHFPEVILPSENPPVFAYLPEVNDCIIYDLDPELTERKIKNADIIFCLDFNALDRVDKIGDMIDESVAIKFLIDHHLNPEPFADYSFSETTASSTCELVYKFMEDLGMDSKVNIDIGTCLFTGIVTDTGSFRYATRAYTYEVAAKLKAIGVDDYGLMNNIFNSMDEKQLRLLGHCLANRMEIIEEYKTAYIYLTKQDYIDYNIMRGDTEGIVNYMLMMKDVLMAAFITEQPTIIKISLRSKGDVNVQEIASSHFRGGGHKNASGGGVYASLEDIINKFKKVVPKYMSKYLEHSH